MARALNELAAAVAALMMAGPAQAATFELSLSGTVGGFSQTSFDSGAAHYDSFYQALTGVDASHAIMVSQGDIIDATVTLDGLYVIPASQNHTDILLYLLGSAFPALSTSNSGTFTFYNGAHQVAEFGFVSTTANQLSSYAALFSPSNGPLGFDSFTDKVTIDALGVSATLDGAALSYALVSVPEPATWALLILGLGIVGVAQRRRRGALAA